MTPERTTPDRDPRTPGWYHSTTQVLAASRRNWKSLLIFSVAGGAIAMGIVLLIIALYAGRWVAENPSLAPMFTLSGEIYGNGWLGSTASGVRIGKTFSMK